MTTSADAFLALDFGGTKLSAAVTCRGEQTWRGLERAFSKPGATANDDITTMLGLARKVLSGVRPVAIGVSFGGPVEPKSGTVRLSDHVPGWENQPLADALTDEFGVPARVDNDANVAALGEYRFGAGQGCHSLLYLTVSTGVGGGWILNERVWHGAEGMAGEIGHTVVDPNGPPCFCGKRGCVERYASGPFIAQDAREELDANPARESSLRTVVELTAQHVSRAAAAGDAYACEVLERAGWALGIGIGNAVNLMNPQRVVLGGGVTKAGPIFWNAVRQTAAATARREITLDIVPAQLGDDAPLWGAVALAEEA
jgi:glucokinase